MGNEASQQLKYGDKLENDVAVTWHKGCNDCPFPARDGHSACSVDNRLFIFGGVTQSADGESSESNDLLCYDPAAAPHWSKLPCEGDIPSGRSGATIASVGPNIYLFGGLSRDAGWYDDVHRYSTETKKWSKLNADGAAPSSRDKLGSAVIDNKIYIFGGFGPQSVPEEVEEAEEDGDYEDEEEGEAPADQEAAQFGWFNDLHIFDTEKINWSQPMQLNLCPVTPRAAHALCAVGKYLVIFGGRDSVGRKNDTHIFDTETRKWETSFTQRGRQPEPRSFHTATTVGSRVVVLGGRGLKHEHYGNINIFDTDTRQWLQPTVGGDKFPARGVHTATVVGDELVVFGGSADFNPQIQQCNVYFNDVFTMKTDDMITGKAFDDMDSENVENVSSNIPSTSTTMKAANTPTQNSHITNN